jgi:methionine-rich copper-binding protein CopC
MPHSARQGDALVRRLLLSALVFLLMGVSPAGAAPISAPKGPADVSYQRLPFSQNWSNADLITTNDDWSGVPGISGFRGDNLTSATGTDPQTLLSDDSPGVIDGNANRADPDTFSNGGVAEVAITDPVVAIQGSGTADAPYLLIHINTTGYANIQVAYNPRDIDGSTDNAIQQMALHHRVGTLGSFTNVPAAYVPDATTGPSLTTLVTPVNVALPAAVDNQTRVQLRSMTTNAVGNDEWVGIDDIFVTGTPIVVDSAPAATSTAPNNGATNVAVDTAIIMNFSEAVSLTASAVTRECPAGTPLIFIGLPATNVTSVTLTPSALLPSNTSCTVTVVANQVTDVDADDPPDNMAANSVWSFTTDTPPTVVSTTPVDTATNVPINTTIALNFSEIVDATANAFTLACPAGAPVTFSASPVLPASDTSSVVLTPSANLPSNTSCTVTAVAAQITDNDGPADQLNGGKKRHGAAMTTASPSPHKAPPPATARQTCSTPSRASAQQAHGWADQDYRGCGGGRLLEHGRRRDERLLRPGGRC